jgi:spoIIIJ-associated protein
VAHAEASARTVEAAVTAAAAELGLRPDQVDVEVLEAPVPSTFGFIGTPARVRVTPSQPAAEPGIPTPASAPAEPGEDVAGSPSDEVPGSSLPAGGLVGGSRSGPAPVSVGPGGRVVAGSPSGAAPVSVGPAGGDASESPSEQVPGPATAADGGLAGSPPNSAPVPPVPGGVDSAGTDGGRGSGHDETSGSGRGGLDGPDHGRPVGGEAADPAEGGTLLEAEDAAGVPSSSNGPVDGSSSAVGAADVPGAGERAAAAGEQTPADIAHAPDRPVPPSSPPAPPSAEESGTPGSPPGTPEQPPPGAPSEAATATSSSDLESSATTMGSDTAGQPGAPSDARRPTTSSANAPASADAPTQPSSRTSPTPLAAAPAATAARSTRRDHRDAPIEPEMVEVDTERAGDFLEGLLDALDVDGDITTWVDEVGGHIDLEGTDLDPLIGPDGDTLDALQELTRLAVLRQSKRRVRLLLDINGFRAQQRAQLITEVKATVEQVIRTRAEQELQPMTPAERKIVHDAVAAIDGAHTESLGEEPNRRVVIRPT